MIPLFRDSEQIEKNAEDIWKLESRIDDAEKRHTQLRQLVLDLIDRVEGKLDLDESDIDFLLRGMEK